ncbi:hypothetical protein F5Y17DRAFT_24859 [Xylariaceae sp. FL0594]|nr:hypothetical protein F5Y17DRAFT_24859 [Xylariaceae sp. FL0594]
MDAHSPLTPDSALPGRGTSSSSPRPRRKYYERSRLGCKTCKSRKIKCDERRPACGNCIRHNVTCDFVETSAAAAAAAIASPSYAPSPLSLNMEQLELLHNYTTSTYATLSESPVIRDFYRITAVQMGLECDYVMRSLLAVSSLQLAYYRPHMRDHYRSTAVHHHEIASRMAASLIRDLNASTVENLFLFSALTVFYAFGSPRRDAEQLRLVGESEIPSWFFLHQGTRALSDLARRQSGGGRLAPLFQHGAYCCQAREEASSFTFTSTSTSTSTSMSTSTARQQLDRLQASIERSEPDAALRSTYAYAVSELRKSFVAMEECRCGHGHGHGRGRGRGRGETSAYEVTDIFVWVFLVGDDLVPLLRRPEPTQNAVAILAFFCVLLRALRSQWWLNGWVEYLMAKSYALLDSEHRLWIQWPMEEIGYVP